MEIIQYNFDYKCYYQGENKTKSNGTNVQGREYGSSTIKWPYPVFLFVHAREEMFSGLKTIKASMNKIMCRGKLWKLYSTNSITAVSSCSKSMLSQKTTVHANYSH